MTSVVETGTAASTLTLQEMETLLKRFGFDDGDPLAAWLNAAMHDLEDDSDWPWLQASVVSIVVTPGERILPLPEDALKVFFVRDATNKRKIEYFNRHKFAREIQDPTELGQAECYTLVNTNLIQLWRGVEQETTFEVFYQALTPNLVAPSDQPVTAENLWPPNTCFPIVLRAAQIALQSENEEERAKAAGDQYEKSLERLRKKFAEQELDEPDTVQDVMGYGGGYGY